MKKKISQIINEISIEKEHLYNDYGIKNIGIFGSYVRGEEKENSDIDILVDIENPPKIDLYKFIEIEHELTKKLKCKVDLVIKDDLRPRIKENIMKEVQYI